MKSPILISGRRWRQISQVVCLLGFLWLFLQTEYRGVDLLPYPVSLLFRIDPLAALADALAPGPFSIGLLWPALLLLLLTFLLGRFFCGWICPLGTTLDGLGRVVGRGRGGVRPAWRRAKYLLLAGLVVAALFGVQQFGLFDPLSIFLRTLTLVVYPLWNLALNQFFDLTYNAGLEPLSAAYPFFRDHLMAFHQPVFLLATSTLVVFLIILLLEKVERRFWCKNLCPLGALLGLCSRHTLLDRKPHQVCDDCSLCASSCRSGVVGGRYRSAECLLCLDCSGFCPQERISFRPARHPAAPLDLPRRHLMTAVAGGVLLAPTLNLAPAPGRLNGSLIRPPGAVEEAAFLRRCIRCGECMKVCIGGALHPTFLQAGPAGMWTPLLVARLGYCEYNCTLCGQVCPTGAIKALKVEEKRRTVIGLAVLDKNRCLPLARNEECLVCEEHCPTGDKAIVFDDKEVLVDGRTLQLKRPRVVKRLCIGCGICETKCPVEGRSAIVVINEGESRQPRDEIDSGGYG